MQEVIEALRKNLMVHLDDVERDLYFIQRQLRGNKRRRFTKQYDLYQEVVESLLEITEGEG